MTNTRMIRHPENPLKLYLFQGIFFDFQLFINIISGIIHNVVFKLSVIVFRKNSRLKEKEVVEK